jgi:hypothetical protein
MPYNESREPARQAFIEQYAHPPSTCSGNQLLSRLFEKTDHRSAIYGREIVQEQVDAVARFKVVRQRLYRHARSCEYRLASEHGGIDAYYFRAHVWSAFSFAAFMTIAASCTCVIGGV